MTKKLFWVFAFLIILFGFLIKIYAIHGNNIFFTVDEARDAVYARQIINYHEIFTKGPQATLTGLYTGPLWYYFISLGFAITHGNPEGAVLELTVLNLATVLVLIYILKKEVDEKLALIVGFGLMIFWPFFETSLWAFNPFALVSLSFILILLLTKNKYALAVIPIILAFNAELAGAIALLCFFVLTGVYQVFIGKLALKLYLIFALGIPLLGVSKILFDFVLTPRSRVLGASTHIGGTNFSQMAVEFWKMGAGIFIIVFVAYLFVKNKNAFIRKFTYLTFLLIFTSYLFFGSNHGWSAWHTAYIPPLTLVAVLLMCWELKHIGKILVVIILFIQIISFGNNLSNYLNYSPNPSLLYNEEKVLDWIYTHNENNGFNLYTYTNTYWDYTYQYLVGWYAVPKYGFYPCEYSNFPLSIKALYTPHPENYVRPQLGCDKFRFLIIDSDTNGNKNKDWINKFRSQTILVDKTQIGNTMIEKRKLPDKIR